MLPRPLSTSAAGMLHQPSSEAGASDYMVTYGRSRRSSGEYDGGRHLTPSTGLSPPAQCHHHIAHRIHCLEGLRKDGRMFKRQEARRGGPRE
ncbi:hypothetical protein ACP70R_005284 [Stipagrostis hirtigluma subsp. patula]